MRRHRLVHENDSVSVWEIEWPPGTGLDWHDHGVSSVRFHVLEGRLTSWAYYGKEKRETETNPNLVAQYLGAGSTAHLSRESTHRVVNEGSSTALSLHFYTPKLTTIYEPELEIVDWGLTVP